MEAGPLRENESSSQGSLESAPTTLCPAQAVFRPSQQPPHLFSLSLTYGQAPEFT